MQRLSGMCIENPSGAKHTASVIFFHGSGSSGSDMKEWVKLMIKNFAFPHIKVIYPTAPVQPYTPAGGHLSTVWFDRHSITPDVPEVIDSIDNIEKEIKQLIVKENEAGIPNNRIIVGGFSMGGALAFHAAYRWNPDVAGVFAFGSFLNKTSVVYEAIEKNTGKEMPPLLQIHGDKDELVNIEWAEQTFRKLQQLGVKGNFHKMDLLGHSINRKGMALIKQWIDKLLPEQ